MWLPAHAVELTGAKPVFVDAEIKTGNIDIDQIEAAITTNTKALSVVHFLGMPVDMDRINQIAEKHNLFVVEDAALAFGTKYKGKHADFLVILGFFLRIRSNILLPWKVVSYFQNILTCLKKSPYKGHLEWIGLMAKEKYQDNTTQICLV